MINTPNKTVEVYNVMLAEVADSPLFVHACVWRKAERRGGSWKKNFWLLDYQLDKSVLCVLLLANTMEMN